MAATDRERFELLAAVDKVADGTLSLDDTVQLLLGIVVPAFADMATLDGLAQGGEPRRLGARVQAEGRAELELALMRRRQLVDAPIGIARAIASGSAQLLSPVGDDDLRALASSDEDFELLRSLGLNATLFVPLRTRGRTLGALACALCDPGRDFGEGDLRFAEVLAGRIALALDNAGLSETVSGLQQRLEATLANLAEAVLVRDATGRIVFANPAAAGVLGVDAVEEITGADRGTFMNRFDVFDERGRRLSLADLPSTAAQRGERPGPLLVRNVSRATGRERWLLNKATPVFDSGGELSLVVSVIEDLTEVKRAELAQRLLAQAGKELASSLDYQQTLQRVVALAVPVLADWGTVLIRGDGDELKQLAAAHVDPAKIGLLHEFGERRPTRVSDPTGPAEVIRSGRAVLVREVTDELLARIEPPENQLALVAELGIRSIVIVPIAISGQSPIGTLTLVMAESGRLFSEDDMALAEELGRRAATAIENARLYTERSQIAATLERSLLPPALPHVPGFRLAGMYRPAGDQNEVGGDFYDVFDVPGGWMLIVGDVAGRGAEAATLTSLSRYTLRAVAKLVGDPLLALRQLNAALRERPELSLVSVCCALLRESAAGAEVSVLLAGHPPAYRIHNGQGQPVGLFAPFLGAQDDAQFQAATVALDPGDQLVLYTDGVLDTVGQSERFGEGRLAEALRDGHNAADTMRRIEEALGRFAAGPQVDDTAVLVLERANGSGPP